MNINNNDDTEDEGNGSNEPSTETGAKRACGGRGREGRGKRTSDVQKYFDLVYGNDKKINIREIWILLKNVNNHIT